MQQIRETPKSARTKPVDLEEAYGLLEQALRLFPSAAKRMDERAAEKAGRQAHGGV